MSYPVRFDLFGKQDGADLWLKARHLSTKITLEKGQLLIAAGETLTGLYFIEHGKIRMDYCHTDGTEKAIWYLGKNSIVGETPYFLRSPCRTNFVCVMPTQVLLFSRKTIEEVILKTQPGLTENLLIGLAGKIRLLNEHIYMLSCDSVSIRLCKYLSLYTKRLATGEIIATLTLNKRELAKFFGIHRVTLYKTIKELEEQGIISTRSKNTITVNDEKKFYQLASGKKDKP